MGGKLNMELGSKRWVIGDYIYGTSWEVRTKVKRVL